MGMPARPIASVSEMYPKENETKMMNGDDIAGGFFQSSSSFSCFFFLFLVLLLPSVRWNISVMAVSTAAVIICPFPRNLPLANTFRTLLFH